MFYPDFSFKISTRAGARWVGLATLAAFLVAGVSCQSNTNPVVSAPVGENVQMAELRQVVETRIADPGKAAALLGITGQAERELGAINASYARRSQEFAKLAVNHKKSANDLSVYLRMWDTEAHNQRHQLINVMLAMKGETTQEEWPHVSKAFMNSVLSESDRYREIRQTMNY